MFEKIKNSYRHPYFQQFRDVRAIGLAVFGVIALMVTWSGIKAVQSNYQLQKQISSLQQQNAVTALRNNNLKLQNQYLNTNEFLELTARREFGLAAPGEKVLLVPASVALAHAKSLPIEQTIIDDKASSPPVHQNNFQRWVDFFLHRPNSQ